MRNPRCSYTLAFSLIFLSTILLGAEEPWQEKPFTKWSRQEVEQVLRDSPWARKAELIAANLPRLTGESQPCPRGMSEPECIQQRGSNPATSKFPLRYNQAAARKGYKGDQPSSEDRTPQTFTHWGAYSVQWASALTMRQAMVRQWQLDGVADKDKDKRFLEMKMDYYVISIAHLSGPSLLRGLTATPALDTASLEVDGNGKKILAAMIRLVRHEGLPQAIDYYFPRAVAPIGPVITPGSQRVEFHCELAGKTIKTTFALSEMARGGEPDL